MPAKPPPRGIPPAAIYGGLALGLVLLCFLALEGCARSRASSHCVGETLAVYAAAIQKEVQANGGTPVTAERLAAALDAARAAGSKPICPETGAKYVPATPAMLAKGIAVADGAPHGFFMKFRGIVRTNGEIARIPESEFPK